MKCLILLIGAVCFGQLLFGETWTLVDTKGRELVVDQLFYDGVDLSVRRVGAYNKMKVSPDALSKECWVELNEAMAKAAVIDLEVVRRTKTSTDSDRTANSGYYTYSREEKEVQKLTRFEMNLRSSSHFISNLTIEYFIISEEEVDCGRILKSVSFAAPLETSVSKAISHTEYNYKSSYGYNHTYKNGDSKAGAVIFVFDADGKEIAQYATSTKLLDEFRGMQRGLRSRMDSSEKKKKKGGSGQSAVEQMTVDKDLL
tara:strand:+ start:132 stop:902 length:771 start_codon:yes stop_codon:yes gene_type:complete